MTQATQRPRGVKATNGRLILRLVAREGVLSQRIETVPSETVLLDAGQYDIGLNAGGQMMWLSYDRARVVNAGKDHAQVRATISRPEFEISTLFDLRSDGTIEITTALAARTEMSLSSLEHRYAFVPAHESSNGQPYDYLWMPNLKNRPEHLVGQHVYRSPCLIIQKGTLLASLVPALDLITPEMPLPAATDFERPGTLRCGLVAHRPEAHVFYRRQPEKAVRLRPGQSVRFGFTIVATDDAPAYLGLRQVVRTIWERYGTRWKGALEPQMLYFDDFARYAYDAFFERGKLWRAFELDGRPVGGISVRIHRPNLSMGGTSPPAGYTRRVILQYLCTPALPLWVKIPFLFDALHDRSRGAYFSTWFNNLRTAFGLAHFGRKWGDQRLIEAAERIVHLALAAPTQAGLFPLAYIGSAKWPAWLKGSRAFFLCRDYGTADLAETGLWMLAYNQEFGGNAELLERCVALGDAFLSVQERDGSVPAWLTVRRDGRISPAGPLRASATTAAAGRFLARLAQATGEARYADGARRAADFIIEKIWPAQEWFDFETFFSCSTKPLTWRDPVSGLPPQNTLSISWAADLLGLVYRATGEKIYLAYGLGALDLLLLFQQVWNASFLSYHTFGGFGVMNTDAEWSDARQALFVPLLLDYYELTGYTEYFERAIAALRASFVLMHVPENGAVAPGNTAGVTELDYGLTPENYGHGGIDRKIAGYIHPDWGSGSACTAAALVQRCYGDLFVDAGRGKAFGINGCRVVNARISKRVIDLQIERLPAYKEPAHRTPLPRELAEGLCIKCVGLPADTMSLWVNMDHVGTYTAEEFAAGIMYHPGKM